MYYVRVQGTIYGPYSVDQLRTLVERTQVTSTHELSTDKETWFLASTLKELFPAKAAFAEPIPVAEVYREPNEVPARPVRQRRQKICEECGEEMPANVRFCPHCGGGRDRTRSLSEPHRGGLILTLAIISLFIPGLGLILAPISWIMAKNDLNAMTEGTMDAEGRSPTQAGLIIGIISTVLQIFGCCGFGVVTFFGTLFQHRGFR